MPWIKRIKIDTKKLKTQWAEAQPVGSTHAISIATMSSDPAISALLQIARKNGKSHMHIPS